MNLFKILSDIEKFDPEAMDRLDSRRTAFKHLSGFGKKVALSAVPLGLSTIFTKAYGQSSAGIVDVLQYAFTLENLEAEFYKAAINAANANTLVFPSAAARTAIETIRDHEVAHVNLLRDTIISLNGTPGTFTAASFDFTAGGMFANVFSDYGLFLTVAQAFEDTGVRAYKGRAAELITNDTILRVALQIHSAEARHASHIRQMRRALGVVAVKPWITGNDSTGAPAAVYAGEENVTQAGAVITSFAGVNGNISSGAASEAFDEPLAAADVLAIVDPFIV